MDWILSAREMREGTVKGQRTERAKDVECEGAQSIHL